MEYLKITGGRKLQGSIDIHGAKNSVLPILAASLLVNGESVIHNCPDLSDVTYTLRILQKLGAQVKREGHTLTVNTSVITGDTVPESLMREMRSSIIFLGALASRMGSASVYLPGGCEIGLRPIDLHFFGLRSLGYNVRFDGSNICLRGDKAAANRIILSFPSVGATENIILASVFLEGTTTVINAAQEPEIEDLCRYLNAAGAKIQGALTPVIEIEGVRSLHSVTHTVIPDRIEATTFLCAAGITQGEAELHHVCLSHLTAVTGLLQEAGAQLYLDSHAIRIRCRNRLKRLKNVATMAYPGFPTDCQALFGALMTTASGTSVITETVFENRMMHVPQLRRFGADIDVKDRIAVIHGVKALHAADAVCTDLRGGAAVVLASLAAEGTSTVKNIRHLDRGYEHIERPLCSLGAAVTRLNDEE